jgi:hypothetical protein
MASSNYTILFHGNCIDGWFSAYIAYTALTQQSSSIKMYPISPSQTNTWPSTAAMAGTHILLVDISVAESYRIKWAAGGALSINCIDHHASAVEHWPVDSCPINTASCAALQTWKHFYPSAETPFWLNSIDRIDRWDNPTYDDRCIREVLNEIAHKPVQGRQDEAFAMTEAFLMNMANPVTVMMVISQGKQILDQKDLVLTSILTNGTFHTFNYDHINAWNLSVSWLGANVFIIDNTSVTLDTTEAAHLVFQSYPGVDVFINYRKKTMYGKGPTGVDNTMYVYSARSRGFNLTDGTILRGHPTSAGASLIKEEVPMLPFIIGTV